MSPNNLPFTPQNHGHESLRLTLVLALALTVAGCNSPLGQRAQRADGLMGFVSDSPGPDSVRVQRVSKGGGEIVTAHAVADGAHLRVSGLVRKAGMHQPPYGSHVDVLVVDARGHTTAAVATDYFPRSIPRQTSRGSMGNAHYVTRFPFVPHAGSSVRVILHGTPKSKCEFGHGA